MLEIPEIDNVNLAFPTDSHIIPRDQIPKEYKSNGEKSRYAEFYMHAWYDSTGKTFEEMALIPRDGVDPKLAWRAIQNTSGSWDIKHQHKEEAIGYMLNEWYEHMWYEGDSHTVDGVEVATLIRESS
tara:strand:- start:3469 stop:3849 length:381 start_codon:yes stop_codon:yes gene_type:complete